MLDVAYEESGAHGGVPVFLMHGWPYDPRCYDEVIPPLVAAGCRVIVPYLRGFGATRFLSADTPRSGQQAALGNDLRELMDALAIPRAVLAGYDWGGRAACIVAALWPERVRGLVTVNSYNLQDIPNCVQAGGAGAGTPPVVSVLFPQPSAAAPDWKPTAARCAACCGRYGRRIGRSTTPRSSAARSSFDNPDFVAVTIQSYRHRYGSARRAIRRWSRSKRGLPPSPRLRCRQSRCRARPTACIRLKARRSMRSHFTGPYERRVLPGIGHNPPQEAPQVFANADSRRDSDYERLMAPTLAFINQRGECGYFDDRSEHAFTLLSLDWARP